MLTQKEIKFLNFLYKKLGGEHPSIRDLISFVENKVGLSKEKSFELAYLYDKNFEEANGDFNNVKNVKRLTYGGYQKSLLPQIVAVTLITKDDDLNNYEIEGTIKKIVKHYEEDGITREYYVFDNANNAQQYLAAEIEDYIQDDPFSYIDYVIPNTFINYNERQNIAEENTKKYIEELTVDELISKSSSVIKEEYENLNRTKEKLNNILGKLINTTSLMDDYLKLHRLGKEEEDQEEYLKLKGMLDKYTEYINAIHNKMIGGQLIKDDMTIEEITNEVDELLYEIDYEIDDWIEEAKKGLYDTIYDDINHKLNDEPYYYFYDKFNMSPEDYLNLDFVNIDYFKSALEYIQTTERSYAEMLGVANQDTIFVKGDRYIIFW